MQDLNKKKESQLLCRFNGKPLSNVFVDLGVTPLANSYLSESDLSQPEVFYPLKAFVSEDIFLVQLPAIVQARQIFSSDYPYYSSYSKSWLKHCEEYVYMIKERLGLDSSSLVLELASNDGYLLQYFKKIGIPVLGVEPAQNVAEVAIQNGIQTEVSFFGQLVAKNIALRSSKADLMIANNVLAHVPDINDFILGMAIALKEEGVITAEFPHLLRTIEKNEFDTIYHEHFSYFSFMTISKIFEFHGLKIFDVEELKTHGGSIRIYGCHQKSKTHVTTPNVSRMIQIEKEAGLDQMSTYLKFGKQVEVTKRKILSTLCKLKENGKTIVGYGAPAKGNTLLNYCGVGPDLLDYTVDISPHKQGKYLPGTRIKVNPIDRIKETKPDYLVILPWNLKEEIISQTSFIYEWGGKHIVPIPEIEIIGK